MKKILSLLLLMTVPVFGALPKPEKYFNDYAAIVSPDVAHSLNEKLAEYEKSTSNQIVVAIYPTLEPDVTVEDLTLDSFRAWGVGQAGKNNGVVLFVFMKDENGHGRDRIEVGRGLEGALTDSRSKDILSDVLGPHLKRHEYDQGFTAAVSSLISATTGEFTTAPDVSEQSGSGVLQAFYGSIFWAFILLLLFALLLVGWLIFGKKKELVLGEEKEPCHPQPPRPSDMRPSSSRTPIRYSRPSVPAPRQTPSHQPHREPDYSPPVIAPVVISDPDPIKYNPPAASDSGFNSGGGDAGGGGATDTF
jgi:uncharacterized protein